MVGNLSRYVRNSRYSGRVQRCTPAGNAFVGSCSLVITRYLHMNGRRGWWAANPCQRTNYSCNVALKCVEYWFGRLWHMRGDDLLKH